MLRAVARGMHAYAPHGRARADGGRETCVCVSALVVQPKAAAVRVPAQAFAAPPADTAPARAAHAEPRHGPMPHHFTRPLLLFSARHAVAA